MILNTGQEEALSQLIAWVANPKERVYRLRGPAGTGKSVLISKLIEELKCQSEAEALFGFSPSTAISITATTNQAAEELQEKVPHNFSVSVIHSFMGLIVNEYQGQTTLIRRRGSNGLKGMIQTHHTCNIIVIDEASYVDEPLNNFIQEELRFNPTLKVLFVYDHKQLLPVNYNECLVDSYYPNSPEYSLTQNERFTLQTNSQIASVAQMLRDVIGDDNQDIPFFEEGDDIEFISSENSLTIALKHFKEHEYMHNANHMLYVAHTNYNVVSANQVVYENMFSEDVLDSVDSFILLPGLFLLNNSVVQQNTATSLNPKILLRNNQKVLTVGTVKSGTNWFREVQEVPVVDRLLNTSNSEVPSITCALDSKVYLNRLKQLKATAIKTKDWSDYYELKNTVADLRLSYAQTVYKSQGKSVNYVMVDLADILEKSRTLDEAKRLLYVAITRARKKVYIIWDDLQ